MMKNSIVDKMYGSHLSKFAVVAMFLLSLFMSSAWGSCQNTVSIESVAMDCGCRSYYCSINPNHWSCTQYPSCSGSSPSFNPSYGQGDQKCVVVGDGTCSTDMFNSCGRLSVGNDFCIGQSRTVPIVCCTTQNEADSVVCVNDGNVWQADSCAPPCNAQCQCEEDGGTWHSNGYCVKDCQTEACCDSLNVPQVDPDSIYIWENNACVLHWKCDSTQVICNAKEWSLLAGVLPDTVEVEGTTEIINKCYFNCSKIIPSDSSKSMVEGNITLPTKSSTLDQGVKLPNKFNSIRSETNGTYTYDFLSSQAEQYLDSIAFTPCTQALYRCVLNNKYVYYYDNQTAPTGCTKTVKIK